jgi:hypothetical protein
LGRSITIVGSSSRARKRSGRHEPRVPNINPKPNPTFEESMKMKRSSTPIPVMVSSPAMAPVLRTASHGGRVPLRRGGAASWAASLLALAALAGAPSAHAQVTSDPFPDPIEAVEDVVLVGVTEFAAIPDSDGEPARPMLLVDEPGTGRMFVNDMRGALYSVSYDGRSVTLYVNIDDERWGVSVESGSRERGFQSFAFHPDFGERGAPGFGKFYTWTDTDNVEPDADFVPGGGNATHHTVLLEWTARDPASSTYDGAPPREIFRFEQPYANHNGGHLAFDPTVARGDAEYGLLYVGSADGGSGGDPLDLAQDLASAFGKVLRIDPLGSNAPNGAYGIPDDNPYARDGIRRTATSFWRTSARTRWRS